ncbi:MAG: hypothetical protein WA913_02290 [Pricia sp.]
MDRNKKYRSRDDDDDDFIENSKQEKRTSQGQGGYGSQHDDADFDDAGYDDSNYDDTDYDDTDYRDDGLGTDYEDLEDQWYDMESDYRERYPKLTDDDVRVEPGRFDMTMKRIGRRTDRTPEQVRQDIENWN